HYHHYNTCCEYLYCMTSEIGGNVPNPFLNLMGLWQNYLVYWIEVSRNFYYEKWLKALRDPWLKARNPSQRETVKIE
ncbi:MAG: hypothetical protein WBZ36_23530, partial [Candidatus Nitrosopolaris sp.]